MALWLSVLCLAGGCPEEPAPDAGPVVDAGVTAPALCEEEPAGTCGAEPPWLCQGDERPRYDCATCGCEDGARCEEQICYPIPLLNGQRELEEIPQDLPLDAYFALIDRLVRGGTRLDAWVDDAAAKRAGDARYAAVAVGLVTHSSRERALAAQILEGLSAAPIAAGDAPTREQACAAADAAARERGEGAVGLVVDAALATREVCAHPEHFPTCQVPFAADCARRQGAVPFEVLVFDLPALAERVERVLLSRAGGFPAGEVDFQLERSIGRFRQSVGNLPVTEGFAITLDGATTFARFATGDDGASLALVLDGGIEPAVLLGFRVVWSDAPTQAFFVEHDITARDCVATREGDVVSYTCESGGYRVDAAVDTSSYSLIGVTRTEP